jgi:hypothetical protein
MGYASKIALLSASVASLIFSNTAVAQSWPTTPITTPQQAMGAMVNFETTADDLYWAPTYLTLKAEATAANMTSNGIIPSLRARTAKATNLNYPNTLSGETLARAFQWVRNSGMSGSQIARPCDGSGQYAVQLIGSNGQAGQYLMQVNYSGCRKDYGAYAFVLDGLVTIRFQMDSNGNVKVNGVKFGSDYQLPTASFYTEQLVLSDQYYQHAGIARVDQLNYEVTGNFLGAMPGNPGDDWPMYAQDGVFSYQTNGVFIWTAYVLQSSNATTPTPIVLKLTAGNINAQGSYKRRSPNDNQSYFEVNYVQGNLALYNRTDDFAGERSYSLNRFGLTNKSSSYSVDSFLGQWKALGTYYVSPAPWWVSCGSGTYSVESNWLTSNAPTSGKLNINKSVQYNFSDSSTWTSINGGTAFDAGRGFEGCLR